MDKLRECPFCGKVPQVIKGFGGIHAVQCECGAITSFKYRESKEKTIAAWNNRHQPPNEPLSLEELRQMDGEPVWCMMHDGSGARWGVVTVNCYGIGANVDADTTYWFGGGDKSPVAYRYKKE